MGAFTFILTESKQNCDIQQQKKIMELAAVKNSLACAFQKMVGLFLRKIHEPASLCTFYILQIFQESSVPVKAVYKSAVVQVSERWLKPAQIKLKLTKRLHPITP